MRPGTLRHPLAAGSPRWALRSAALAAALAIGLAAGPPAAAGDLGTAQLLIAGTRLTVSPESQTVPLSTPTVVETHLEGYDTSAGALPESLRVLADLSGPEIDGVLTLSARPGDPLRVPRLTLRGEYRLDDIRLVDGEELLAYAEPRSAAVLVTQVLVTRVTSRPLTLDEVRSYGIVLEDDSFRAFNFTFGFAVDGEVFDYNVPILYNALNPGDSLIALGAPDLEVGGSTGTTSPRFRPPRMAPFTLRLERDGGGSSPVIGGCGADGFSDDCRVDEEAVLPGVILFPSEVSLLNQFFSVVLVAKNDAPEGDPLTIRDLAARVVLPPALRMAETEPPTPLGVPVPVRVPGADGELGTADDLTFLIAQAEGQAEVLVEGRQRGTHVVEFQLEGVLDGLAGGRVARITGTARGAVIVRDPTLGLTISHPQVVREDEEYPLRITITNTSNAPVNLVSVALPPGGLSGAELLGSGTQTVPTLLPGESEVLEFPVRSLRTGRVVASSVKSGSRVDPSFELTMAIGDGGVPLSPEALILPRAAAHLPDEIERQALGLLGLGVSLAAASETLGDTERPRLAREQVDEKAYWLAQAGRHVELGEETFDSVAQLAAEWLGARDGDWEWDALRRTTDRGGKLGDSFAQVFAAEAAATSRAAAFRRLAETAAHLGPQMAVLAEGAGARLEVASLTSGRAVAGEGLDPARRRELPFADLWRLGDAQAVWLARPEPGGYQARMAAAAGGADALVLVVPDEAGSFRRVRFDGVALAAGGLAVADFRAADDLFTLYADRDGDGVVDTEIPGAVTPLAPRPFTVVAVVQSVEADPSGHVVDVLLSADLDLRSLLPVDPGRFTLPGKLSNGGLVPIERDIANVFEVSHQNPFEGLRNTRIVRVIFDNPISPYASHDLTVSGLAAVSGQAVGEVTVPVVTTVTEPGTEVEGTVYGPDGQPVPFALVELREVDFFYHYPTPCRRHKTAAVRADSAGKFRFDYVRQTRCSDVFSLTGADPVSGHRGTARGRVRFEGGVQQLDVLMLGRGTLRGNVTYEDGSVPSQLRVVAYSPVFYEGREARVYSDGRYEVGDVPVGTVSLVATDREGNFVFQTEELPTAGAVRERDLVIIRRPPDEATGDVRGTVYETDGFTPVFNAYLALYVDGELAGVERSAADGTFDFGTVPAGRAEIEAFDAETGLTGAQVFFDVEPDQVNDVSLLLRDDRGVVEGKVYRQDPGGAVPVAGAVVWVSGTPFNTVSAADGSYRLDGVFAGTRTVIAADLANQVQASASVTVNGGGEVSFRDLYFPGAGPVSGGIAGEVLGFTGSPVAGAAVHIATGGGGWWHQVFTDTLGRFTIPDLGPGSYKLYAVSGLNGAVGTATIRFQGETPFVTLRFKKGTIRGTVRAEIGGGPPVGVTALVTYRTTVVQEGAVELDWEPHTIETNPDGTFEIPDVLAGAYSLHVSNSFHGERRISGEIVFHGEVREHDVLFQENGTIRGTVLDWDGETPVAGAKVNLHHPAFGLYDLVTDAEGRFAFELVPPVGGRIPLDAEFTAGTVFRRARVWVRFDRFGQELDVEITLPRQGAVSGFVEDAGGNPVPGAVVTLTEHAFPGRRLIHNADGEGQFSFPNVFAGRVSLAAKAPALGGLASKATVEVTAESEEVFALLQLEPTGEIVGHVLSPVTGMPVPSVQVSLYRHGGGLFDSVTAGADGAFRFVQLPLGQYRVWVFDPTTGRHGEREGAWVEFNNHVREADVTLEVRGAVDGHLLDPGSGAGVPGATVRMSVSSLVPFTTYSSTNVDGYFEYLGIPESDFTLRTREPEGRRRASGSGSISIEGERVTVDLVLEASGGVSGTVLAPPGAPAGPFANVNTLLTQDSQVIGATLDNPFDFGGVIAGRGFRLEAREVGGPHRGAASGRISAEGEVAAVDVTIRPIGEAEVTVRDSFGTPVPGADVRLRSSGFYGGSFQASAGPDGKAVFQGVGEGHLDAWATDPATQLKGSASGALTLEGERVLLDVQLADSGTVLGRVLLSDGVTPAEEALVVLTRGSRVFQALADADGAFTFSAVPLGSLTVFAQERFGPGSARASANLASNGQELDLGTLVMDDHDPAVDELEPALYATGLPLGTAVTVRFTEPIDAARFTGSWIDFRRLSGGTVAYTRSWTEGDATLILTPNAPLANSTSYQVTVKDAYDLSGRRLSEQARTVFTTADVMAPTVIDVLPRDGDNQVPIDANLVVTFSEPVVPASLSGAAFQLTDLTAGQPLSTTWQQLPGERQVILTPVGGLATDREYRLTVQGVEDSSGNVMTVPVSTTFWSVDTVPPEITAVSFPAGTSFTAGDEVPVAVEATDLWGVAEAAVRVAGWRFADDTEPFVPVALAPVMASAGDVELVIEATDVHGNTAETTRTIQVVPLDNASAPEVWGGCLVDGDAVIPGIATALAVRAADDQAIESLRVLLDGVEVGVMAPVSLAEGEASYPWTPPAEAAPGTAWTVRLEARDFAGNLGVHELEVAVPTGTMLIGGRSLFGPYDGQDVTLAGGTFLVRDPLAFGTLRVVGGAEIVAPDDTPHLELTASGELRVQCGATVRHGEAGSMALDVPGLLVLGPGGRLDADGRGYRGAVAPQANGGAPAWVAPALPDSGGSHGGRGTRSNGSLNSDVYDSVFEPILAGGGGARRCPEPLCGGGFGTDGGGAVRIDAGTLRLEGEVLARGAANSSASGAGAGGAVAIRAGTLSGRGRVDASGGGATHDGPGGGGRVAAVADALAGPFDPASQLFAGGGARGSAASPVAWAGAGTVYARLPGMTHGLLRIANGEVGSSVGRVGPATPLPALGGGAVLGFTPVGGDAWIEVAGPLHPRWRGVLVVLEGSGGEDLGSFRASQLDPPDRMLLAGAGGASGAVIYRGEYRFDRIELVAAAITATDPLAADTIGLYDGGTLPVGLQLDAVELRGGTILLGGPLEVGTLTVGSGTVLRPTEERGRLEVWTLGDLTIEPGVVIDVDALGYRSEERWGPGSSPPWVAASTGDAGGSHAGFATWGNGGTPGEVYDSVYEPRWPGGSGVDSNAKAGGGVVVLEAGGVLSFDGEIRARGLLSTGAEAGAGGTVVLRAGVLQGSGIIDASGGDNTYCYNVNSFQTEGSGGGGRVAIHAQVANGFDPAQQVTAQGGYRIGCGEPAVYGGPGTVLHRLNGQTYGTLRIDNGQNADGTNRTGPPVELPALGTGAVTSFEAAGDDGWVTVDRTLHPRWLGAWMALADGAGGDLGVFRVAEIDGPTRARLEGASAAASAATFRGEYRFDAVDLLHGGGITSSDPIVSPDQVLDGNVEVPPVVVAENLRITAGSTVRPVTGGSLHFEVSGELILEEGAVIDVSGRGYPEAQAPPWVAAAQWDSGGSHGGTGSQGDGGSSPSSPAPGPPGEVFDSVYRPSLAGGGGIGFGDAPGGGVLTIRAGQMTFEGLLKADAVRSGAGGTVRVEVAGTLSGSGTIKASGGTHDTCGKSTGIGMGGGGRIAVHAGVLDGFDPAVRAAATGGELNRCTPDTYGYGGAGTVFWRTDAMTYGRLRIDNGVSASGANRGSIVTELPALGAGAVTGLEATGADAWVTLDRPLYPRWLGAWMVLLDAQGAELGAFEVVELDGQERARLDGASGAVSAAAFRGEYRFDRIDLVHGGHLASTDPLVGPELDLEEDALLPSDITATSVTVRSGAVVRPASGEGFRFRVGGALVVEAGAAIDVSGGGYEGGPGSGGTGLAPAGVAGSTTDAGGSHGGVGIVGDGPGPGGEVYDSLFHPVLAGGGGAGDQSGCCEGRPGGGVLSIEAANVLLDGQLIANGGSPGFHRPSGAGGTVWIAAGSVSGTGTILANGGDYTRCNTDSAGSGGGGRVAIEAGVLDGFEPALQVQARGGRYLGCSSQVLRHAAPGTAFSRTAAQTYGVLRIDQGGTSGLSVPVTTLPAIGRGVIGVAEPDGAVPADLWIEPLDPEQRFGVGVVGMHVRVDGVEYRVLAEDVGTRRRILLGGAAGAVDVGDGFVGIYRFDSLTLAGDADLTAFDGVLADTVDIEAGSVLTARDVEPPAISILTPAEGTLSSSGQPIDVSADVTDNVEVVSVTFRLEDFSFVDQEAPWEWTVPAPVVGEERDALIEVEAIDLDGNVSAAGRVVRVQPLAGGDPPTVVIGCPSVRGVVAPGTGLDLHVDAGHLDGIERVELFVDGEPLPLATDFAAPYVLRLSVPAGTAAPASLTARVRATSFAGTTAEATLPIAVIDGAVVSGDTLLAAGDTSLDGGSVVVAGGTLTVEGPHSFGDLSVLDGAAVTHSPSGYGGPQSLELSLAGDLFIACGGAIDTSGRGFASPAERVIAEDHFNTSDSLARWRTVDAPGAVGGPSNWFVTSDGRMLQNTQIRRSGDLAGTHLVWEGPLGVADYRVSVLINSGDDDDIGLLFRYRDPENHYRFRWRKQGTLRALERVEGGVVTVLASEAVPYVSSRWYRVEVDVQSGALSVRVDGQQVLAATDPVHDAGGVALYCDDNHNASFDDFRISLPGDGPAGGDGAYAYDPFLSSASLASWQVIDQGRNAGPSNWIWENGYLRQTKAINSWPEATDRGTFAIWTGSLPADYRARVRLLSTSHRHIGLMFRYQDGDSYYRFRWDRQTSTRVLERFLDGQRVVLAQDSAQYGVNVWYTVEVEADGRWISVRVDGELVLAAEDGSFRSGGVALYNASSYGTLFDDFQVGPPVRIEMEGGSHGGRGGGFLGGGRVFGSLFDPHDPGAGGGGPDEANGGGSLRIAAAGAALVDGLVTADGLPAAGTGAAGAGGSVRLDAAVILGDGSVSARGGAASGGLAAGSGGRIALYAGSLDEALIPRVDAGGGAGDTPGLSGGAGTVYVKRDPDPLGELILDNRGVGTTQLTELPALLPGTVGTTDAMTITDPDAAFPDSLFGVDVYLNGDTGTLWPVLSNTAQSLLLDTSQAALTAQPGEGYAGLYRFDRVTVRGGARGLARSPVWSTSPPEVEAGSEWLSGYEPSVEIVEPVDGEWFVAGETLTVTAEVSNLLGVGEGRVLFLDRVGSASLPPYSTSFVVPPQATVGNHPVTFELTDLSGGVTTATREVELRPSSDAVAPEVAFTSALPADRDVVEPGTVVSLPFSAVDDALIERYSVRVDGELAAEAIAIGQPSLDVPFEWVLPADGPAGHEYLLRVEVRDYAGNLGFDERRLRSPAGPLLNGSQNLDASWAGSALTLGTGSFTAVEPLALDSLVLLEGAVLTAPAGSRLVVEVEGEMRVQTGARIDMFGKGYPGGVAGSPSGGAPAWVLVSESDGGGSHGGSGSPWNVPGSAGEVYDSVAWPVLGGGGGALDDDGVGAGHPGGGVVEIRAGALVLAGDIVASSPSTTSNVGRAGGAGGSVLVETGMLSGTGSIHADGGNLWGTAPSYQSGSGGGGRVALHVGSLAGFDPASQVTAYGGTRYYSTQLYGCAAPGTVFVREGAGVLGDLRIEASAACATQIADTELPELGSGSVAALEPASADAWLSGAAPFRERWLGVWVVLLDSLGGDLGAFEVLALDESGRVLLAGASGVVGAASYRGEYSFDRVEVLGGAGLIARDPVTAGEVELAGGVRMDGPIVATDLVVRSGAVVGPVQGGRLRFEVVDTMTVEAGAKLDVMGLGYAGGVSGSPSGGAPAWVLVSESDGGGSHGGSGSPWNVPGSAGEVYDSVAWPVLGGGGGALDDDGSGNGHPGGGVVEIRAGALVLAGDIVASSPSTTSNIGRAGGAGGSVLVETGMLSGTGSIHADGGNLWGTTPSHQSGSGGGGRVALHVGSLAGFDPASQVTAFGGTRYYSTQLYGCAAPGTVFAREGAGVLGDLRIEASSACATQIADTELPELGSGSVAALEPAGADAWLSGAAPFRERWLGAWVVLLDSLGGDLGAFEVLALDESGRVLLAGASGVVGAATYRGEYRFARVEILGGAGLVSLDPTTAGVVELAGAARVSAPIVATDVVVRSGSVVRPAEGSLLRFEASGTLTVEAGAKLDVSAMGYPGGTPASPAGGAPAAVAGSEPDAGGSHGGFGVGWTTAGPAGEVYDSVYQPRLPGAGGALDDDAAGSGGGGGGVVDLVVGNLILDGDIEASGYHSDDAGISGGAGGTVRIVADLLGGTGTIVAMGGRPRSCSTSRDVGAGGGGRVALYSDALSGFDPIAQILAYGQSNKSCGWTRLTTAGSGTVFVLTAGDQFGTLIVDQKVEVSPTIGTTLLPVVGNGLVGVAEPDPAAPADLWIEPQDPVYLFSVGLEGVWVRVDGLDFRVVEQSLDRRRLRLEGAAGLVDVGDAFEGVYKFDTVRVLNQAVLEVQNRYEFGNLVIESGGVFVDNSPP